MFTMNWFHLDNQTAFVTGAGSGIGQGIALGLAQAGANVACFDLATSAGLAETVSQIGALGQQEIGADCLWHRSEPAGRWRLRLLVRKEQ